MSNFYADQHHEPYAHSSSSTFSTNGWQGPQPDSQSTSNHPVTENQHLVYGPSSSPPSTIPGVFSGGLSFDHIDAPQSSSSASPWQAKPKYANPSPRYSRTSDVATTERLERPPHPDGTTMVFPRISSISAYLNQPQGCLNTFASNSSRGRPGAEMSSESGGIAHVPYMDPAFRRRQSNCAQSSETHISLDGQIHSSSDSQTNQNSPRPHLNNGLVLDSSYAHATRTPTSASVPAYSQRSSAASSPSSPSSGTLSATTLQMLCPYPNCQTVCTGDYAAGNIHRHIKQKHGDGEVLLRCNICENPFKRGDALKKHQRDCHPELGIEPPLKRPMVGKKKSSGWSSG